MARWKNFSIWRGRLPHWRADDVLYYATFRHRRALLEAERRLLLRALLRPNGTKWWILAVRVGESDSELMFTMVPTPAGSSRELADVLEKAKARAGKEICRGTGERFAPFYGESYDRIVRDEEEREDRIAAMIDAAEGEEEFLHIELGESSEDAQTS